MLAEISMREIPSPFLGHNLEPWRTLQLWLEPFTANVTQKNLIPERFTVSNWSSVVKLNTYLFPDFFNMLFMSLASLTW